MPQNGHSTVYRKTSASTAKSFRKASMERELADWTEAIKAAESHDVALKLLSEKQAAQQDLLPPVDHLSYPRKPSPTRSPTPACG